MEPTSLDAAKKQLLERSTARMAMLMDNIWYKCQELARSSDTAGKNCIFHGITWYQLVPMSKEEIENFKIGLTNG